ncbi:MAG: hypothetical protein RBU30_17070 [Polyangia bacterium]|jgi:hypothetical protein|nr:hypothetical protein [Polyangia bacterium]
MVAIYGNLMVMGITIALFVATVSLGRKLPPSSGGRGSAGSVKPQSQP